MIKMILVHTDPQKCLKTLYYSVGDVTLHTYMLFLKTLNSLNEKLK